MRVSPIIGRAGATAPPGQQQWTTPGTYSFVVPDGVTRLWALTVGGGGGGGSANFTAGRRMGAGAGAGLAFCCLIVTPGETLTIVVGTAGAAGTILNQNGFAGGVSAIRRGATDLMRGGGGDGGLIGTASPVWASGGVGYVLSSARDAGLSWATYSGGRGGPGDGVDSAGGGGGASGYAGQGGDGGQWVGFDGSNPALGSGGAGGGKGGGWGGGGVGLLGKGADGAGGSGAGATQGGGGGSGGAGAGNSATGGAFGGGGGWAGSGAVGGARVFWGGDRSYPSNAPNV